MRLIISMLLHAARKDLKSLCSSLAFCTIRKVLFIFKKKKL
jgi:hypothetical protein